jgi:hypothetical protein
MKAARNTAAPQATTVMRTECVVTKMLPTPARTPLMITISAAESQTFFGSAGDSLISVEAGLLSTGVLTGASGAAAVPGGGRSLLDRSLGRGQGGGHRLPFV